MPSARFGHVSGLVKLLRSFALFFTLVVLLAGLLPAPALQSSPGCPSQQQLDCPAPPEALSRLGTGTQVPKPCALPDLVPLARLLLQGPDRGPQEIVPQPLANAVPEPLTRLPWKPPRGMV